MPWKGLNDMVQNAQTNNWIRGFQVSSREDRNMIISNLQYADDALIFFCEPDINQVRMVRVLNILFESIFGLHINLNKSYIYQVIEVSNLPSLSNILGGRNGELPTTYFG